MGNELQGQLGQILGDDNEIEEVEAKVEYEDGEKVFRGDEEPVLVNNDVEEDQEDQDSDGADAVEAGEEEENSDEGDSDEGDSDEGDSDEEDSDEEGNSEESQ